MKNKNLKGEEMFKRMKLEKNSLRALLNNYNLYSSHHKFIRKNLNESMEVFGRENFADLQAITRVTERFKQLKISLEKHAEHEDLKIHPFLKAKDICKEEIEIVENEHQQLDLRFKALEEMLNQIFNKEPIERIDIGENFNLKYSEYMAEYYKHIISEEKTLMPEMRKLGVEELRENITFPTFSVLSVTQIVGFIRGLFPCLNLQDKFVFLVDIYDSDLFYQKKESTYQLKFPEVWQEINDTGVLCSEEILIFKKEFELETDNSKIPQLL